MLSGSRHIVKWAAILLCVLAFSCKKDEQEPPKPVTYEVEVTDFSTMRGSLKIGGKLYMPKGLEGKKPAVIRCHGLTGSYKDTEVYAKAAAKTGVVACCFDFCGGHEGSSLSDGDRVHDSVLTEVEDLSAVYDAMANRPDIDPSRIMVMGGSQGGLVAALYAAENPSKPLALGLLFPAFNIPSLVRTFTFLYGGLDNIGDTVTLMGFTVWRQYAVDAYNIFPYKVIGAYEGPVIIIHGTKDILVPLSNSEDAVKEYKDATLIVLEDQPHGFDKEGQDKAIEYLLGFIDEVLGRKKPKSRP